MQYKLLFVSFLVMLTSCATKKVSTETHTSKESVSADTLVAKTSEDRYHNVVSDIETKQSSETIVTIKKFFENSLNVSETSRQLFIHRNTLVYRLDKIQKNTGLDIRVFEDAITFKIALMVVKYMKYMETLEY